MNRRKRAIRQQVEQLLKEKRINAAPVDVEALANSLGIEVKKTSSADDISGFLLRREGVHPVIGINILHHPNRQRFTIGHELGHYVLNHKGELHVDRNMVRLLRDATSSTGEIPEEIEANRFAAELLMPAEFLERDFEDLEGTDFLDDRRMLQLAKRYRVSVQAMTRRLIDEGYISEDIPS